MKKADLNWGELTFSYMKTNCHLEYYFRNGKWDEGQVVNDDTLNLNITAQCLHYGQECFEGIKVFEDSHGNAQIFRVDENAKRMARSAKKILMEPFPEEMFIKAIDRLVNLNKEFIPPHGCGASLYIRPLMLGISPLIGVKPSADYLFLVLCTPVGPYFKTGLKPIDLVVAEDFDRAAPLGIGDVKVGGNYAAGLRASKWAHDGGYTEVLYLDSKEKSYIDESGPANFFGVCGDKYITPASDSILPSITNMSLMTLAEDMGMTVEKRPVHVNELNYFDEAGCCGTAAVITPIQSITHRGKKIVYSEDGTVGKVSQALYDRLTNIQLGLEKDKFGWIHKIPLD